MPPDRTPAAVKRVGKLPPEPTTPTTAPAIVLLYRTLVVALDDRCSKASPEIVKPPDADAITLAKVGVAVALELLPAVELAVNFPRVTELEPTITGIVPENWPSAIDPIGAVPNISDKLACKQLARRQ